MNRKMKLSSWGKLWGRTILVLLIASILLSVISLYTAHCLVELALGQEYVYFLSVQEDSGKYFPRYNDGIDTEEEEHVRWDDSFAVLAGGTI